MISYSTTTITIQRRANMPGADTLTAAQLTEDVDPYEQGYDTPATGDGAATIAEVPWVPVAQRVRAHLLAPGGFEQGRVQEDLYYTMLCDPCDLQSTDQVVDETTGITYNVVWATNRVGLGLDHTKANLEYVRGLY